MDKNETQRDRIITSETADRMLDRVSPIYENSYVGLWMYEAIGREYDDAWYIVRTLPDQLFPETVTWAIELWERRYAIIPKPSQTLEERRAAVITARAIPAPFTPAVLEKFIYNLTGRDALVIDFIRSYTFGVYVENTEGMKDADLATIIAYINKHKHSHMSYDLVFQASTQILIGVETGYWRIPYRMAGTAKAGQLPQPNIAFEESEVQIVAESRGNAYPFHYMMSGTHPEINVIASSINARVDVDTDAQPYAFSYPAVGEAEAGQLPQENILFGESDDQITAEGGGSAYRFPYTIAGTRPDINVAVSNINAGVEVDADAQPFIFSYPVTGETEAGEQPEYTMTGDIENSSIRASPSGEAFSINYILCGMMNSGAEIL